MERAIRWLSPSSQFGSVLSAIAVHALLYGAVVAVLGFEYLSHHDAPPADVEVGYEVLNEPPPPAAVAKPMVKARDPETPVESKPQPDTTPKELQDEQGTVAGTQTAVKTASNVGSDTHGTADSTPYYKIKPKYPRAALVAGTEGWILLKVDINEGGGVENVRVVDGENRNMFQDEARRAVEKWKYRPFLGQDRKPLRKADHQVRVDFKLNDA